MRIIFIQPNYASAVKKVLGEAAYPLGFGYLASVLGEKNEIKVIDALSLDYSLDGVGSEIKRFDPDVVGVTATTPSIYEAYGVARIAKEINSDVKTIIGGPHATFTAKETLKECKHLDVVVRGEGEETMRELSNAIEREEDLKDVLGITFREDDKIVETGDRPLIKNLDEIPFPAYDLLPQSKFDGRRYAVMMTSRGCPFKCIFCSSSLLCGKVWRGRSPENVVEELRILKSRGIDEIEFLDDTFTLNGKRVEKICDLIEKEKLDVSWSCSSRVNTINKGMAEKMKEVGCHTVYMGVESGTEKILKIISKGITLKEAEKAVKLVKEVGLNSVCSFVLGVPGETAETMKKTITFAKKLNPTFAQFTLATPYPGTRLFEIAKEKDYLLTKDWSKYTTLDPVMKIPGVAAKQLKNTLTKAYIKFYFTPLKIFEQLKERRFSIIKKAISAAYDHMKSRGQEADEQWNSL
jgi:radical SAM superfamily enzyme YgiQ (UPF0313 family)